MLRYIPNTTKQKKQMLAEIGVCDFEELISNVPKEVRLKKIINLPRQMSETELLKRARQLSERNADVGEYSCFLGAGSYDHYIPSIVEHILSRQEFYTAYTPYQPEISQGTLQAIFEYQTMICELTGMEAANASLYDGATAIVEAVSMICETVKKNKILVAKSLHPESRRVLKTYGRFKGWVIKEIEQTDGQVDLDDLERKISSDTATCILQNPNFFGVIENLSEIFTMLHSQGIYSIVSVDPISLGILKPPGEVGADVVVGEGQSLGNPLSFGGPYLGFFATKGRFIRRMPGRIVGQTVDKNGKTSYVLTIQSREQHIRRQKATSNICSNQALNALAATIYLSTLGKEGIKEVALHCFRKAHYAYEELIKTGFFKPLFNSPFFKEFAVISSMETDKLNSTLMKKKIIGGYSLDKDYPEFSSAWLLAVTEKRTRQEIDDLVKESVRAIGGK